MKIGAFFGLVEIFIVKNNFSGGFWEIWRNNAFCVLIDIFAKIFEAFWRFTREIFDGIGDGEVFFGASDGDKEEAETLAVGGTGVANLDKVGREGEHIVVATAFAPRHVISGDNEYMLEL